VSLTLRTHGRDHTCQGTTFSRAAKVPSGLWALAPVHRASQAAQELKPSPIMRFSARLKSCPDTCCTTKSIVIGKVSDIRPGGPRHSRPRLAGPALRSKGFGIAGPRTTRDDEGRATKAEK